MARTGWHPCAPALSFGCFDLGLGRYRYGLAYPQQFRAVPQRVGQALPLRSGRETPGRFLILGPLPGTKPIPHFLRNAGALAALEPQRGELPLAQANGLGPCVPSPLPASPERAKCASGRGSLVPRLGHSLSRPFRAVKSKIGRTS